MAAAGGGLGSIVGGFLKNHTTQGFGGGSKAPAQAQAAAPQSSGHAAAHGAIIAPQRPAAQAGTNKTHVPRTRWGQ